MRARFAYLPSIALVVLGGFFRSLTYIASHRLCYGPCVSIENPNPFAVFLIGLGLAVALLTFLARGGPRLKRVMGISE